MVEPGLEIAGAIGAVGDLVDDLERLGPARALGLGRGRAKFGAIVGDGHQIGDAGAIGGPAHRLRAGREPGDLDALPAVHPADEDLRAPALAARDIGKAAPVGGPGRAETVAGPRRDRALLAGGHLDQPDRRARLVGHDVVGFADVGDAAPVGADLRIRGRRQPEQVAAGEGRIGRLGRCRQRRRRSACHQHRHHAPAPSRHDRSPSNERRSKAEPGQRGKCRSSKSESGGAAAGLARDSGANPRVPRPGYGGEHPLKSLRSRTQALFQGWIGGFAGEIGKDKAESTMPSQSARLSRIGGCRTAGRQCFGGKFNAFRKLSP